VSYLQVFFFFSSRRRHTRYIGDWSSDVCSSDLAWNQGWPIGVFQFVKSAKWRVGEERALRLLGETGQGGAVSWNKMGEGWSWIQRDAGGPTADDRAEQAAEGWAQVKRDLAAQTYRMYVLDEFTYPMKW